jgi:hypothetical protein
MRFRWPKDTVFHREVVDVEQGACHRCGQALHICDHRIHRIFTLKGPVELVCRLAHCSDPTCPARGQTLSPAAGSGRPRRAPSAVYRGGPVAVPGRFATPRPGRGEAATQAHAPGAFKKTAYSSIRVREVL